MVMVPKIAPGYPTPSREPMVAYMIDLFTRPCPFRADAVIDVSPYLDLVIDLLGCHESQFLEWMPWIERNEEGLPREKGAPQRQWLRNWYLERTRMRTERFWNAAWGPTPDLLEAFELSEYAGRPTSELMDRLFPDRKTN